MVQSADIRSDGELLRLFSAENDQHAFEELVKRHATLVFNVCSRILSNRQEAEDATQAVFLTLAHKADSLKNRATIATWLYQVAWHVSLRARANLKLRAAREKEAAAMNLKPELNPESNEALKSVLDAELNALPERLLQPLILHHLEGHSEQEGARALGIKLGTFSSRLNRARETLRARLANRGLALPSAALIVSLSQNAMSAEPPVLLLSSTVKAAVLCKAGEAAAAQVVSGQALQMFHGAVKMLVVEKLKTAAATAACLALLVVAGSLFYRSFAASPVAKTAAPAPVLETKEEKRIDPPVQALRILGGATFQPPGNVASVVISQDEKFIAASGDKFIAVWDIASQTEVARATLKSYAFDLRFRKDNSLIVVPDSFGFEPVTFLTWDWANKQEPKNIGAPPPVKTKFPNNRFLSGRLMTFFPDESIALAPGGTPNGGELKAVDLTTGKPVDSISGASREIPDVSFVLQCIAVSPDGSRVACVDKVSGWSGENIKTRQPRDSARFTVWDWKTKQKLHEWIKSAQYVEGLQFTPDGKQLFVPAFGSWNNQRAVLFDAADGREIRSFSGQGVLSADASTVTTYRQNRIQIFSSADGMELDSFGVGEFKHGRNISLSPGGRYLSLALSSSFMLVDLKEKKRMAPSEGAHQNKPYWMQYAADGRLVLYDGALSRIYDDQGNTLQTLKSSMYRTGGNNVTHDGRLLVAPGGTDGRAEVWDLHTAQLLGHLGKSSNAVQNIVVSKDDQWALLGYEYNGRLRFFDLSRGEAFGEIQGHRHEFFGPVQQLQECIWSKDGNRAYIADTSSSHFQNDDLAKMGLKRPLGLAGAYYPGTGIREFWFKNSNGEPIECVEEIDLNAAQDTLFVMPGQQAGRGKGVLVSAADGAFLRSVEFPGRNVNFSEDGKLLVGTDGVVDVLTGKWVHRFDNGGPRYISPSRTLVAQVMKGAIDIVDVRSGRKIWQCNLGAANQNLSAQYLVWHPAESQIAINPTGTPAVAQIDLFANVAAAADLNTESIEEVKKALVHADFALRQAAVQKVIDAGAASIPMLQRIIDAAPQSGTTLALDEKLERRMAIFALERIARERSGFKEVLDFLNKRGPALDADSAAFAADAALRLNAAQRAIQLSEKLKTPEAREWPKKGPVRPGQKPPAPPQDF